MPSPGRPPLRPARTAGLVLWFFLSWGSAWSDGIDRPRISVDLAPSLVGPLFDALALQADYQAPVPETDLTWGAEAFLYRGAGSDRDFLQVDAVFTLRLRPWADQGAYLGAGAGAGWTPLSMAAVFTAEAGWTFPLGADFALEPYLRTFAAVPSASHGLVTTGVQSGFRLAWYLNSSSKEEPR